MIAGLFHSVTILPLHTKTILLSIKRSNSSLYQVILPSVKHKSPEIRCIGIKLLGLFCLFDKVLITTLSFQIYPNIHL